MTDYRDLIKELREQARLEDEYPEDAVIKRRAADALEAQAKRVAEKDARIAELEAALQYIADEGEKLAELRRAHQHRFGEER
jgi:hypothetical protein